MKIDKKISDNILELSKIMDKNNLLEIDISDGKNSYRLKKISHQSNIIENYKDETFEQSLKKDKPDTKDSSLKSPLVGTAYLCPEPGSKAFIEVGQTVKIGQVILIIEAMKTMNEITADRNGIVKKIFVKNETPVEFGEPLVLIE